MKLHTKVLATMALTAGVSSAHAGIPVIDGANLFQAIQQVAAWAQQYSQMVDSIQQLRAQYAQLQTTYNSMTGNRGLGTILNGPAEQAARRYLPDEAEQLGALASGSVAGYGALQSTVAGLKGSVSTMPSDIFGFGTDARGVLTSVIDSLATQKATGQAAYSSAAQRTADLENMIATIGAANDPKAIAEIQARVGAQQALVANDNAKVQAMAYMQQAEQQQARQRATEVVAKWARPSLPAFTMD